MLIFCLACTMSYAQDSNNELLRKLVEKNVLTQGEADSIRLADTENQKGGVVHAAQKIRNAFNTPYMQFGGYGMFMYKYSDVARIKHTAEPRVLFLTMKGELFKDFSYFVMGEFVDPRPFEFWVEWTPKASFKLKAGQMKTPFSLENQLSLTAIEGIQNTRSVSALAGMNDDVIKLQNGKNSGGRDIGVLAHGSLFDTETHKLLEYGIGLYQGTGLNKGETNNTKDFVGNVMLQPIKGFRIGGGTYFGEATYAKPGDVDKKDHVRNRWIASTDYKTDRIYARAEWIKANDGGIDKEGLHGMGLYYFIPQKLNAFAKVDYLSQDKAINKEVMDYTCGVNYYFYPSCRFQVNYTYSDYSKSWDAPNSNVVLAQMQIVF